MGDNELDVFVTADIQEQLKDVASWEVIRITVFMLVSA
jgi:hypothetical protein